MNADLIAARDMAWAFFKAGWTMSIERCGGFMTNYCGTPNWDMIQREEFEAFVAQNQRLWEEENMAKGIKAFNQVFVNRDPQPIPTPDEAIHPGKY